VGSLPLLRWARGPLPVPYRPGTPHTGFKSKQGAWCDATRYHVSRSSGPCLPALEGSGATMCFVAPDLASLLRRAPVLPRVPWLRTPPLRWGGLQCCHVSHGSEPHLPTKEGSGGAMYPTTLCGPRGSSAKEVAAGPVMRLGSHVPKAHAYDSAAVAGKGCTFLTSVAVTIKANITCGQVATMQCQPP
jgi:hypothetical protein